MIPLRPSFASVWTRCYAAPRLASMMPPEPEGDPAREGTCAAWVAEMVLTQQAATARDLFGQTHANGWVVTLDMCNQIQDYVDLVRSHGGSIHVERKVRLNGMIEGTPDAFALLDAQGVLYVIDLKYGYGIVEPFKNPQVSIYAGAILRFLHARGVTIKRVVVAIYQPRAWHVLGSYREWPCSPETLMAFVQEIEAHGVACQNPAAPATPGSQCEYCPAASTCSAVAHELYRVHDQIEVAGQRHMTDKEMAQELKFLLVMEDMITGRRRALTTEAEERVKRGGHIPGWHMEERRGNRRFKYPPAVVKALTGIDPVTEKPMTPAELEKAGVSPKIVATLSEMPRIESKLKPIPEGFYSNLFSQRK